MKRLLLIPALVLVAILFIAILTLAMLDVAARRQIEERRAAMEEGGLTLMQLAPPITDGTNGAPAYGAAFALLRIEGEPEEDGFYALFSKGWDDARAADARKLLAKNGPALAKVREAATSKSCRFPLDYDVPPATDLSHHEAFRQCARLLAAEGMIRGHSGDLAGAVDSFRTGLRLGASLRGEPFLLSALAEDAICAIVIACMADTFADASLPSEQCRVLIAELNLADWPLSHTRWLFQAEAASGLASFDACIRTLDAKPPGTAGILGPDWWFRRAVWPPIRTIARRDQIRYLRLGERCVEAAGLPFHQSRELRESALAETEAARPWISFARAISPDRSGFLASVAVHRVRCREAMLGFALKCYKERQGRYPGALEDLVPGVLQELPQDPFTGRPFRYQRKGEGFIVYSLGENGTDEGGKMAYGDGTDEGGKMAYGDGSEDDVSFRFRQ